MRFLLIAVIGLSLTLAWIDACRAASPSPKPSSTQNLPGVKGSDPICKNCGGDLRSRYTPSKTKDRWEWRGSCLNCGASYEWISRRMSFVPVGMEPKPKTEPVSIAKRRSASVPTYQAVSLIGTWFNSMYRKFVFKSDGTLLLDGIGFQGPGKWRRPFPDRPDIIRIDHHNLPPAIFFQTKMVDGMLDLTQVDPKSKERLTFAILLEREE